MMDDAALSMLRAQVALLEARIEEADGAFHFRDGPGFQEGAQDEYHRALFLCSFAVTQDGELTATMLPGEVELGPATRLTWDGKRLVNGTEAATGCLTNHLTDETTITVTAGSTKWYVWANVDITDGSESWEIFEGATVTPLVESEDPDAEIKTIRQKILVELTIVDDVITEVVNRQCGNIDIPRL